MQLVELQETVASSHDTIAVFAVSYDPVVVLRTFADEHGITYPLLGDVGSTVINDLGLRNVDIVEERAYWGRETTERHTGLPYPATFVLDEDGVIVEKIIERSHRIRPTGRSLLEDLAVIAPDDGAQVIASAETDGVAVTAWVASRDYFPNQIFRVGARLAIADGLHLYVPPTPDSYTNLTLSIDAPDGVYWDPPELPEGSQFSIAGLDGEFHVVEGMVELSIPVHIHEDVGDVTLSLAARFQACSEDSCLIPDALRIELPLVSRGKL
ncbi:MAG: protein-disulfide reductase DsbD family protein [Acidimicrobiia bacterium]|nr:protein-disulfide reductase DsbD family protein [Acidimicrobiia bacterium]